eukprot:scaffold39597_cov69-Phaeocystis_antarctica.AAC.1
MYPSSSHPNPSNCVIRIAHLEGKGARHVLCIPEDEERGGGGAREVHGDARPLLGVGEGEWLLGSEAAAGPVDDKHQASVRCPHLARGARWHGEERSQGDCRGVEVG